MRLLVAQLLNRVGLFVTSWSVHGILQVRILECVAIPISRVSSQPRDRTWTPWIAGGFFTIQVTRKAHRTKSTTKERFIIVVKVSVNEINVLINETAEKSLTLSIM